MKQVMDVYREIQNPIFAKSQISEVHWNKNVLFVDEGIESGLTMMASIKTAIAMRAKTVVIATPVMPLNLVPVFESVADEVYGFYKIANFVDTKFYYEELNEPAFEDVLNILNRSSKFRKDNYEL